MTDRPIVILSSARRHSETRQFINKVFADTDYKLIDLLDFDISPYNYSNNYTDTDNFLEVVDELLKHKVK